MLSGGFGWPHLLIILLVVIVLFGAKRLPDAARGVGKSLRIFKSEAKAMRDGDEEGPNKGGTDAAQNAQQQLPQSRASNQAPAAQPEQQRQNDVQA
ncbi:MAG: Sec-independent protein translocase subunit TatA [Sciscionella sp.]